LDSAANPPRYRNGNVTVNDITEPLLSFIGFQ